MCDRGHHRNHWRVGRRRRLDLDSVVLLCIGQGDMISSVPKADSGGCNNLDSAVSKGDAAACFVGHKR